MIALLFGWALAAPIHDHTPSVDARFSAGNPRQVPTAPWWDSLGDPGLTQLVTQLLESNPSLQAAHARVAQAQAMSRQSAASLWPTLSANGNYTLTPASVQWFNFGGSPPQPPPEPGATVADPARALRGTLDVAWQPDVFGRNIHAWKANRFAALAAQGDRDAQILQLTLQAATIWYDHALATQRLAFIDEQVQRSRDLLEVLELRFGSDASVLDVLQQRQQLAATSLQRPIAEASREASGVALAVLIAETPGQWTQTEAELPEVKANPPIGTPADLLTQRPDLRSAVANVESTRRRRLSAERAGLPRLTLHAQWGRQSSTFFDDHPQDGPVTSYGAAVSVPLFEGLRTRSAISAATYEEKATIAAFENMMRQAIADVERALVNERRAQEVHRLAVEQLRAASLAFDEAKRQYLDGIARYLTVQTTLAAQQSAELTELDARHAKVIARLALYQAIGAPIDAAPPESP